VKKCATRPDRQIMRNAEPGEGQRRGRASGDQAINGREIKEGVSQTKDIGWGGGTSLERKC